MQSHFHIGISKGCSVPPGLWCSTFAFWKVKQADTNYATSFFMPCHQKVSLRSWYILVMLGCKLRRLLCLSSRINLLTSASVGTQTLPMNLNTPSLPMANFFAWSDPSNSFTFYKLSSIECLSLIKLKKSLDIVRALHLMNSSSNSTCSFIYLNPSINSNFLIMRCATCIVFLLKESVTMLAFPKWYRSLKSVLQELYPPALPHIQLLLIKQILEALMITEHAKLCTIEIVPPDLQGKHHHYQL